MTTETTDDMTTDSSTETDVDEVDGLFRLEGIDESLPHDGLAPLKSIVGDAKFVGLGESIHTSGGYYRAKFRVFRYLVERLGFRAFAMESPWQGAEATRAYVDGTHDDLDEALGGLFGVWRSRALADLLDWIREFNEANPDDPIHFFGYDVQQPWYDYPFLGDFLAEAVPRRADELMEGLETNIGFDDDSLADHSSSELGKRMSNGEAGPEVRERYRACDEGLEAIERLFATERDELIEATSRRDVEYAEVRLVGLRAWMDLVYYEFGLENTPRSVQARDRAMAFALRRMHRMRCPEARTAVWAHNMHLNRANDRIDAKNGARSMGTFLADELGDAYRALGLIGRDVRTNWTDEIDEARTPVDDPEAIETILASFDEPYLLYDTERGELFEPGQTCNLGAWDDVVAAEQFDGLLFLDHSPPRTKVELD